MTVATAVVPAAAINASTPPIAFQPLQGYFSPPAAVVATTVPAPAGRHPFYSPARQRRLKRQASRHRAEGRREARIYNWASRSFLAVDPQTQAVALNNHGNTIYGMLCYHAPDLLRERAL